MTVTAPKHWTVAEFLAWDDGTDQRYELVAGAIVAMAPVTRAHSTIALNIGRHLGNHLKRPCHALVEAAIARPDRNDRFYSADVAVTCTPATVDERPTANPVVVVEVLSPSTAAHDRGVKLPDYLEIPSIREILLVDSERRRVQHWRREADHWLVQDTAGDGMVALVSVGVDLPLAAIYADVALA